MAVTDNTLDPFTVITDVHWKTGGPPGPGTPFTVYVLLAGSGGDIGQVSFNGTTFPFGSANLGFPTGGLGQVPPLTSQHQSCGVLNAYQGQSDQFNDPPVPMVLIMTWDVSGFGGLGTLEFIGGYYTTLDAANSVANGQVNHNFNIAVQVVPFTIHPGQ